MSLRIIVQKMANKILIQKLKEKHSKFTKIR